MDKLYFLKFKNRSKVEVKEEIYRAYQRPIWREDKNKARRKKKIKMVSLNYIGEDKISIDNFDDDIADKLIIEEIKAEINKLSEDEKKLIIDIYFNGKSERAIAKECGVSNVAINKRHHKIIEKLKKIF